MQAKSHHISARYTSANRDFLIAERIVLALHLAVMISFTEVAPFFNALHKMTGVSMTLGEFSSRRDQVVLRQTNELSAATLMLSRLVLFAQNGIIFWHLRHYRKAWVPMFITVSIPLAAAICYAAVLGATSTANQPAAHDMLFVVSMLEIVGNLAVSLVRQYKVVSFEGSHLAERLNLLTLIILGEGQSRYWLKNSTQYQSPKANLVLKELLNLPRTYPRSKLL